MMGRDLFGLSSEENLDAGRLSLPQTLVTGVGTRYVTPTEAATDKDYLLNEWTVPNILVRWFAFRSPGPNCCLMPLANTVTE